MKTLVTLSVMISCLFLLAEDARALGPRSPRELREKAKQYDVAREDLEDAVEKAKDKVAKTEAELNKIKVDSKEKSLNGAIALVSLEGASGRATAAQNELKRAQNRLDKNESASKTLRAQADAIEAAARKAAWEKVKAEYEAEVERRRQLEALIERFRNESRNHIENDRRTYEFERSVERAQTG